MPGAFLCWPPPCPIRIKGRVPVAPSGVHSTPGISSRVKSCSRTPSDDVWEVKRIAFRTFRDAFCGHSLGPAEKGGPTCHSVDRSHLLSSQCGTAPPNLSRCASPTSAREHHQRRRLPDG